jgi:hypothetical protein
MTQLRILLISCTEVSDAGLEYLRELSTLTDLDVVGTQVTYEGIQEFKSAHPECLVATDEVNHRKLPHRNNEARKPRPEEEAR